ncbi:thiol reductant ABC exporter subunit CydD [Paracandidimonas soli]|uniref:ATP-binding cassette subfamily C protein CydD n=1 Tax=Paracandidimonas soli TaxID=1917182 RepID=A0A4R3VGV7_9BURK|nr:thiol reductant ABC exporter subunit CydD [Paracandidimonas soli]TCV03052.1 ATP-binding cassette subfamily C protein CydD [Paracandidimonas soli]
MSDPAVTDDSPQERIEARRRMRWLADWRCQARFSLGLAVALPLVGGALLLAQAWCLAHLLGGVIAGDMTAEQAQPWILAVVALLLVRAALAWAGDRAASLAAARIKQRLRLALFDQLMERGPQWTRAQASGQLSSALLDMVDGLEGFFSRYIPSIVAAIVLPPAFGLAVLPVEWIAGLLLLLTAPLVPLFMVLVGWGAEAASRQHQRAMARLSGLFADRLRGIFTLRLFGRAEAEVRTVRTASRDLRYKTMAVLRIAFLSSAVLEFFAALGVAGVAVYIGLGYLGFLGEAAASLSLTAGMFCLFMAPEVYLPLRQMAANYHDRANARAAVAELESLFGELPAAADADTPQDGGAAQAQETSRAQSLAWRDATIQVAQRSRPVIDGFCLDIPAGRHVALMGRSGAGKTTLVEAALGLRRLTRGKALVDGVEVSPDNPLGVRHGVVLIGQKPFFFAGTIAENLRMGRADAAEAQLWEALRQAQADGFVGAMPQGLDTEMAAGGHGFSGGQLHRLALSRLFLSDPGLILLDEPTAHLDAGTRDRVMQAVVRFAQGRTLVVVTHDVDVAAWCGQTVVLPDASERMA